MQVLGMAEYHMGLKVFQWLEETSLQISGGEHLIRRRRNLLWVLLLSLTDQLWVARPHLCQQLVRPARSFS